MEFKTCHKDRIINYFKNFEFILPHNLSAISLDQEIAIAFLMMDIQTQFISLPDKVDIIVITESIIDSCGLDYERIWGRLRITGHLVCLFKKDSSLYNELWNNREFLGFRFRAVLYEDNEEILQDWQTIDPIRQLESFSADRIAIVPEVEQTIDRVHKFIVDNGLRITQDKYEIMKVFSLIYRDMGKPITGVEVGSLYGGSLMLFSTLMDHNGTLSSVDIDSVNIEKARINVEKWREEVGKEGQNIAQIHYVTGQSWCPETIQKVLNNNLPPWDFVFIDGAHTYNGVIRDFITYSRWVRSNGYIIIHDIDGDYPSTGIETGQVWQHIIKPCFPVTYEFHGKYGTGVVEKT